MYPPNILFWCYVLLLIASSSESRRNSTNNDEKRDILTTMRYDSFFVNFTKDQDNKTQFIPYNLHENLTKSNDEMQYEFRINSTNNDRMDSVRYESHRHTLKIHEENNQTSMKSRANSTKINIMDNSTLQEFHNNLTKAIGESDFTSYQLYGNSNRNDYNDTMIIISHDACVNKTCIQLCCPFGDRLTSDGTCVAGPNNYSFPNVYQNNSETKKLNELFPVTVYDPCVPQLTAHHILNFDEYSFLVNGHLHQDPGEYPGEFVPSTSYCLAALERNIYDAATCKIPMGFPIYMAVCLLVSLPFLLLTFVVYSLLPEVQNVHSCTLRAHVGSLFIMNLLIYLVQAFPTLSEWKYCIPLAYIFNFALMSACFWLNATCFDIWWTFRKLSLRPVHAKKKKKRFILYSLYAWGITFLVSAASAIMDYAPGIPKNWTRPRMCTRKFWFGGDHAMTLYFYGPTGTAYVINVFLFIATALTILYHNKHTASQLRDSESRCYDNHKRKFTMYLKLFIVMGLSWTMGIILWLINASNAISEMVWNISFTIDILQGVFIFILYVCKRKTLRLLLKRFGWQNRSPFLNNILSSNLQSRTSSNMSHLSSLSGSVNMQNTNLSINLKPNHHATFNAK